MASCKQADVWLAALEAGDLDKNRRIRLQEHLERCEDCRQRAERVSSVARLIGSEAVLPSERQMARMWQRLQRPEDGPVRHASPLWKLGLLATAALAAVVVFVVWPGEPGEPEHRVMQTQARPAVKAAKQQQQQIQEAATKRAGERTWMLVISSRARVDKAAPTSRRLPEDGQLQVGRGGVAVVASSREVVIVRARSTIRFGARVLQLDRGEVAIATYGRADTSAAGDDEVEVRVAEIALRPMGTAFSVAWSDTKGIQAAVVEGTVRISRSRRGVDPLILRSGERLVGWRQHRLAPGQQRSLATELERAVVISSEAIRDPGGVVRLDAGPNNQIAIDGLAAGRRKATAWLALGRHDVASPSIARPRSIVVRRRAQRIDLVATDASAAAFSASPADSKTPTPASPATPASSPPTVADVRRVETLLAARRAVEARQLAEQLLASARGAQQAVLATLIAETHVQQRSYPRALKAYLNVWQTQRRSPLGADALYMAGTLQLEQLRQPCEARLRFERYLREHKQGRQREGAFLLLARSLVGCNDTAAARQVASRYLTEYRAGQFTAYMQRLAAGKQQQP